ncbi:MAG: hypothetical protein HKO65_19565 [Gemmatimonadetes bacterium]|nr:hypothetical protein [Gemmatimonadota bacterium]NNM07301.1 hypothetical protein [Gemmatimonadota bacterium]
MFRIILVGLISVGIAGAHDPASAQEELELRVIPRFGLLAPDAQFYDRFKNFSGDGYIEWTSGALGRAALVGLGVEAEIGNFGILFRGEVARSFEGWLSAGHGILIPRVFFEPPQVVNTWFDVPVNMTFGSLQIILPTRLEYRGIQPYILAGYAGKWYSFGEPTRPNEVEAILPGNGFTHSLELGGGLTFALFGLTFDAQLKDSINKYWEKTQNDLVLSGGLIWSIR